jgi:flagellar basal body-associated protein FliL
MLNLAMNIFGRDAEASTQSEQPAMSQTMVILLVVLLSLLVVGLFLVASLMYLRYRRRVLKQSILPEYNEKRISEESSSSSSPRRTRARQLEPVHVFAEKQDLMANSSSPPDSPLPEIRITFPEEVDESGKRKSGRVVVVHMGDSAIGMEPVVDVLPAYQKSDGDRFQSIDLERVGGLIEKAKNSPKKEYH